MKAMRWLAAAVLAGTAAIAFEAYGSVSMQLAWEQLLVLCGH